MLLGRGRRAVLVGTCALLAATGAARALGAEAPAAGASSVALFRLDPLGIPPEIVTQLEGILRVELSRLVEHELPSKSQVDQIAAQNPRLAACTASPTCLQPLAKALKVSRIVAGNVGGLADSYVVNLKLVDAEGRELRRVSATLRGSPEELILEIRVALVRLISPEKLVGQVAILSDVPGATVELDGRAVGQTPLDGPLAALSVGVHQLKVTREGFSAFEEEVPVRFEKTTQVVVRQSAVTEKARRAERRRRAGPEAPLYARWYFITAVAVTAVAVGIGVGFAASPRPDLVDCRGPKLCQ
jgi:hypothetical protein